MEEARGLVHRGSCEAQDAMRRQFRELQTAIDSAGVVRMGQLEEDASAWGPSETKEADCATSASVPRAP